jgi:hypothetical protein
MTCTPEDFKQLSRQLSKLASPDLRHAGKARDSVPAREDIQGLAQSCDALLWKRPSPGDSGVDEGVTTYHRPRRKDTVATNLSMVSDNRSKFSEPGSKMPTIGRRDDNLFPIQTDV